jgi:hypothetical protein
VGILRRLGADRRALGVIKGQILGADKRLAGTLCPQINAEKVFG